MCIFTAPNHALQRTPGFGVQLPSAALIRPAQSRAVRPAMKPGTARAFASRRRAHTRAPGSESLSLGSLGVIARMSFSKLLLATLLSCAGAALASPRDDLGAASQQTRDEAARELRSTFVIPPRARWEPLLASIKPGDSKTAVLERLRPFKATFELSVGIGQSFRENYRLDDAWVLLCFFVRRDAIDTLTAVALDEYQPDIWVAPPPNFSGVWTTYFLNGQRSREINYADGHYSGVFTAFHSDGSKAHVQHYGPSGIADGDDTGYFPSGRIMYRAFYKKGSPVGTWTRYNEDGSVQSTTKHQDPTE